MLSLLSSNSYSGSFAGLSVKIPQSKTTIKDILSMLTKKRRYMFVAEKGHINKKGVL